MLVSGRLRDPILAGPILPDSAVPEWAGLDSAVPDTPVPDSARKVTFVQCRPNPYVAGRGRVR
jgi:hypothetical protein